MSAATRKDYAAAIEAAREAMGRAIEVIRDYPMYPDEADGCQLDEVQKSLEKALALLTKDEPRKENG